MSSTKDAKTFAGGDCNSDFQCSGSRSSHETEVWKQQETQIIHKTNECKNPARSNLRETANNIDETPQLNW